MNWENIDDRHQRARVPGGWLVKAFEDVMHLTGDHMDRGWDWRAAIAFVPDEDHSWSVGGKSDAN